MQNKLLAFLRQEQMIQPGDTVVCAVSGGADSMALLWAMYRLKDRLHITVQAAHFNHRLRGAESDRDEAFVLSFCKAHAIPCHLGSANVEAGKKGLEAAAREARYAFLQQLPGKIATAHTADDNAETLLLHLIRGTGLKGLGGIAPARENLIRPMLTVTRQEVLAFLEENHIFYVTDSSNETDAFLRNRIRHHILPLFQQENPAFSRSLSDMALRLRQDEAALNSLSAPVLEIAALRQMPPAIQTRALSRVLTGFGVQEPEAAHIALLRRIVTSDNPSAKGAFPGNITIGRRYGTLARLEQTAPPAACPLRCPGETWLPEWGIRVICRPPTPTGGGIRIHADGALILRSRQEGDRIRLPGGTKTLKKLLIDRKIPACERAQIPVIADAAGVAAVPGIAIDANHAQAPNVEILIEKNSAGAEK